MRWTMYKLNFLIIFSWAHQTLNFGWADELTSINSNGTDTNFDHPFFQADGMFLGEMLCMLAFYIQRVYIRRKQREQIELAPLTEQAPSFPKYIFYAPALCDMVATSTMYLGLTLTNASSFQMLRGSVIIFTGIFSMLFLGRRLRYFQWLGILFVMAGLVVVGLSDYLGSSKDGADIKNVILGDALIIVAQVVTATQMVVEEKFLTKYNVPPLLAVGWEGVFGFITLSILLVPFYWTPAGMFSGNPRGVLEDVYDAIIQLKNNPELIAAISGNIISIAFFNFAGVSVTKELSATTRMVLDSVRTLVIWLFSLAVHWQTFQYLQPIGFVVLVLGMMLYNDLILLPWLRRLGCVNDALPTPEMPPQSPDAEIAPAATPPISSLLASDSQESPAVRIEPM
ncbi:unnamed protein product, partial [Meganyctiphanes norvegica]